MRREREEGGGEGVGSLALLPSLKAVPCQLVGLKPFCSTVILENAAGLSVHCVTHCFIYTCVGSLAAILRNIAFENDAYRMEVKSCGGIEMLLEVSVCPPY